MTTQYSSFAPPAGDAQTLPPPPTPPAPAPAPSAPSPVAALASRPTLPSSTPSPPVAVPAPLADAPRLDAAPPTPTADIPAVPAGAVGVPTLPTLPAATPATTVTSTAPEGAPALTPPADARATTTGTTTGTTAPPAAGRGRRKPGRRWGRILGRGAIVVVIAAGLGVGWRVLTAPSDADSAPTDALEPRATDLGIESQDVSSPLIVPIDDARDVIADIDENAEEATALEQLGLDPTGNVVVPGYRFTWASSAQATVAVTVDATTGDYSFASDDGLEYRRVDGVSYAHSLDEPWVIVDGTALESIARFGLDAPIVLDEVIDPVVDEYASTSSLRVGELTKVSVEIDDARFLAEQPDARSTWVALMGIPDDGSDVAEASIVRIEITLAADGRTVDSLSVTSGAASATYALVEVFAEAPTVTAPEV